MLVGGEGGGATEVSSQRCWMSKEVDLQQLVNHVE